MNRRFFTGGLFFLPEAEQLFARMTPAPDFTRKQLIDQTIRALIVAGLWNTFDALHFTAAHDAQAARLDWKDAAHDLTVTGSPAFTADSGYKTGSSGVLEPSLNLSVAANYGLGDASASIWADSLGDGPLMLQASGTDGTLVSFSGQGSTAGSAVVGINQSGGAAVTRPSGGLLTGSRKAGAGYIFLNGELYGSLPTEGLTLPSTVSYLRGSPDNLRFVAIGAGRTEEQEAALYGVVSAYLAGL